LVGLVAGVNDKPIKSSKSVMNSFRKLLNSTKTISSIIVGLVFLFSGFVKGIDLLGSTYKFADYFVAFGIPSLEKISLPLAFILSAAEFVIGAALIIRIRMEIFAWLALIFMGFFTPLTLYIAIANPVSDCGCFGDALVISNWETFWKNVVLILLVFHVFFFRRKFRRFLPEPLLEWGLAVIILTVFTYVSLYSYKHLPVFDFRPFHIGANIPQKMSIPPDAPFDEYEVVLFYEKDGVVKEFTIENLPDTTWNWVDSKSTLISKGYEPPIKDFSIESTEDFEDITNLVLENESYTFLLVAHDLNKSDITVQQRINAINEFARHHQMMFLGLTASPASLIEEFKETHQADYDFYNTDDITLKTMIRSNPGLILMKSGTIIGKWHYNDIPDDIELSENLLAYSTDLLRKNLEKSRKSLYIFAFLFLIAMLWNLRKSFK
jgi:hypothetical protein